jgi:hypothetical protein
LLQRFAERLIAQRGAFGGAAVAAERLRAVFRCRKSGLPTQSA